MNEILFSNSPIDLVLSFVGVLLAASFPLLLGQKAKLKDYPKPLYQFVLIILFWNIAGIIGNLFFSSPKHAIGAQIIFGIQALGWIQLGNVTYHIACINFNNQRSSFWRLLNILGGASVLSLTIFFCVANEKACEFFKFNLPGLDNHPVTIAFSILFAIFVIPELFLTCYVLLRNSMHVSDPSLIQINTYMLISFSFFFLLPTVMDFVLPFAFAFNLDNGHYVFLQWYQYCSIFLAIMCGQYYTSVSFKNKSSWWFLNNLQEHLGDSIIYFNDSGSIIYANPAARLLFQTSEADISKIKIQQILPDIDVFHESTYNNIKVQINNELHTFNVGLFKIKQTLTAAINVLMLSDQTNLLFYQQRIKMLDRQFKEYKQDLIRYQDRLDLSEKKTKESDNINITLINALPFQFWSKNENGVYQMQNQKDISMRGNLSKITDEAKNISEQELDARDHGKASMFTTYENADHQEITEGEASINFNTDKVVYVYQNHFIPIIQNKPPHKVIGLKIDMTEEKRLERERNILREQKIIHSRLEELGTACGAFAHDYNNILGSQIGFCELAQELLGETANNCNDEKIKLQITQSSKLVSEATKAAQRGKVSLNALLDTVRGKTKIALEQTVFPPAEIVHDVINKVAITLPSNIQINSCNLDEKVRIKAQAPSLDRILSNLSSNAIYAMKQTGGTLTFTVVRESLMQQIVSPYADPIPTGEYVRISVSDTGTGMDSGTLERIFAPFFTTKAPGEGLGLGLSSALRLLKDEKAYFTVQTTVGEGTTFNLYWSLYKERETTKRSEHGHDTYH